ncbi:hypothetical protein KEM54_006985 [Ascosphaera aggregata]|nr:hypothetical protein KEM54_006985 [Ascosphaera aggregata]
MGDDYDYRYRNVAGNGPPNMGFPPGYLPGQPLMMPAATQGKSQFLRINLPDTTAKDLFLGPTPAFIGGIPLQPPMPQIAFTPFMMSAPQAKPNVPPPSVPSAASESNLSLPGGIGLVLPKDLTLIHVISANVQPWNNPGGTFTFQAFKVPSSMTVQELIEHVCPSKGPQNQEVVSRGIVEIHEHGNGRWLKAQEFWLANQGSHGHNDAMKKKIAKPIAEYGWNSKRGTSGMPVWISCLQHYG